MIPSVRAPLAALRIGFRHVFAYRTEVAIQLLAACFVAGLNGSIWSVATKGRAEIAGVPGPEMLSYVCVSWVAVSFFATRVNEEIGLRFRDGQIAADLLRPLSLQMNCYARDLGRVAAILLLQTIPLFLLTSLAFSVDFPTRLTTWPLWLLSLTLSHLTNFSLSFLLGLAAFRLHNITGLTHFKATLVSIFSGALIPLELFGERWQPLLFALPFHSLAHTPSSIFLERDLPVLGLLGEQAAWGGGLWLCGVLAWNRAAHALTVQGG